MWAFTDLPTLRRAHGPPTRENKAVYAKCLGSQGCYGTSRTGSGTVVVRRRALKGPSDEGSRRKKSSS